MQILGYILPALVVLAATWLVLAKLLKEEQQRRMFELKKNQQDTLIPIRLRGYERLALFLERIEPEHLLMERDLVNATPQVLQMELLDTIRQEFEHNLSQQIYVSNDTWMAIVVAKEEMLRFVNTCAANLKPEDTALSFAQQMLTIYASNGETPTQKARTILKNEARALL